MSDIAAATAAAAKSTTNETLRKIHAQSSAETSGLGDSLQRIHALSSTETSGYGGEPGVPSPTGQVSSYTSTEDVSTVGGGGAPMRSPSTAAAAAVRPSVWVVEKERTRHGYGEHDDPVPGRGRRSTDRGYDPSSPPPPPPPPSGGHVSEECYEDCFDDHKWQQIHHEMAYQSKKKRTPFQPALLPGHARRRSSLEAVEGESDRGGRPMTEAPLQGGGTTRFGKRGSAGSTDMAIGSGTNHGGASEGEGVGGGHFLGKRTQSAWLRWSYERRASFKRKVEFIEQRQNELQRIRVSSPVRKARKESMRFVSPELEDQHRTFDDDLTLAHPAFPFDIPPTVAKRKTEEKEEVKLTLAQWNALVAFWEHDVFVRSRFVGFLFGLASLSLIVTGLATSHWFNIDGQYRPRVF